MYVFILFFQYLLAYIILNKEYWNKFTRLMSCINAIQCTCMVLFAETASMYDIYYVAEESSLKSLFFFASYLFVDGTFQILDEWNLNLMLSVLHHFVGGLGIYIIVNMQMGFFLGYYFAMTEISTIFLNFAWFYRKRFTLIIFYVSFTICRILSIPFLFEFLKSNAEDISFLTPFHYNMVYYGSYTLTILNFIWFILLTKKILSYKN